MRHRQLHTALRALADDAAAALAHEVRNGAEVPFELAESGSGTRRRHHTPLYCYRPLTGAFIRERLGVIARTEGYPAAAQALERMDGVDAYLGARGEKRVPRDARDRADAALRVFLDRVFEDSTDFALSEERFERAYGELEAAVVDNHVPVATLVVGLPGIRLASEELPLAEGITLMQAEAMPGAPADAAWLGAMDDEPNTLAVLTLSDKLDADAAPARLRRVVRALRLYDGGAAGLAPAGWARLDSGPWQLVDLHGGSPARAGEPLEIEPEREDELRAFVSLVSRRMPRGGELAWALRRFDLACERPDHAEALTDLLLALRALLEPEGPDAGMLASRLAALCATGEARAALEERVAHAIALERTVVAGLAPRTGGLEALVDELTDHLRALLGDALCGHLSTDLRAAADGVLLEEDLTGPSTAAPA